MTEVTDAPLDGGHDRTEPVDIQVEMQRSYIEYAMSVIVGRALPDVRDGLKPVHVRILYAMLDGGYRPDRGFFKCSRVVGDVMGNYHPHGDSSIYDALVRMAQPWSMRMPLIDSQGNFGSPGNDPPAAMRYTECRLAPLAMEMLRDINEDTVDFRENYDGRSSEPVVLPSRFPNLLINGSEGIAVGMATKIPPHNLREVAGGVAWYLDNFEASDEELLEALMARIKGPDFPTSGLIVGRRGISDAYRTGRGSIVMRAVVEVEEIQGRTCLVATELPFQVNRDNLAEKIGDLVRGRPPDRHRRHPGRVQRPPGPATGHRAEAGRRSQGRAQQPVQAHPAAGHVRRQHAGAGRRGAAHPAAGPDDQVLGDPPDRGHRPAHPVPPAQGAERMHIVSALLKAIDRIDEVIALIRACASASEAQQSLMALLEIDEIQARAILDMQLRKLAALERQELINEHDELAAKIADYEDILASPQRQRDIVGTELGEIVHKFGDDRRTEIVAYDGEVADEDLIAEEDVAVTITYGGYAKRTRTDLYRAQRRGGKGVRGAQLRTDDIVDHFFITTTHHWILFFTNKGRVYRAKGYELPDAGRDARGQHVANLLAFQPDERIAEVLALRDYQVAPYLVLATQSGLVKKSRLTDFDSPGPAASSRSTCARTTRSSRPGWSPPRMTCCWSARARRPSGSTPTTTRCGRWAGPPPASSGCASTTATSCSACTWSGTAATYWWPPAADTPSEPPRTPTRYRAAAAAASSPRRSWRPAASWSAR